MRLSLRAVALRPLLTAVFLVTLAATGSSLLLTKPTAQTTPGTGTGATVSSSSPSPSASSSVASATPADPLPVISLSVQSANPQVAGYRPGVRAYYSMTVTDNLPLKSVVVTTSPMIHSSQRNDMYQCAGKTWCEEKVYIIVPANPGSQFVTVTATDSLDQVSTKTVTFDAPACMTDADCGGGATQWAGTTYCGSEDGSLQTSIMQYGIVAVCKAGGICDTASKPLTKQQCTSGQVCTFNASGINICIAQPPACTPSTQVSTVCMCGPVALNYPADWRARAPTYCCPNGNGSFMTYSPGPCPVVSSPLPAASSASTIQPRTASAATLSAPRTATAATLPSSSTQTPSTWAAPTPTTSSPAVTPGGPAPATAGMPVTASAPVPPSLHPADTMQRPAQPLNIYDVEAPVQKLKLSQIRSLSARRKRLLRELKIVEKFYKRTKDADALADIADLRTRINAFKPVTTAAYDVMLDFQDEVADLRLGMISE